jgi:UDP-2,3-diacylglucosamine hydrolase
MAPLGIIAGLGDLPLAIAENAVETGQGAYVLRLKGFEDPALEKFPGDIVGIGEVGGILKKLKAAGCEEVVFAGIVKRPDFGNLKLDVKGVSLLPKVLSAAKKGDDALLRILVAEFEKQGFKVLGSHEVHKQLLAPAGVIAGQRPTDEQMHDIEHAARVASATGALDIGQGAVVCDGLVLAVEAQEGTDAMLDRCASLPEEIRGTSAHRNGVLVKRPKPQQELRIDLPTTGVSTVEKVAAAGLAGLAVEAGGALLLNRPRMIERAEELGVFIYGFSPEDGQ